MATKSTHTKSVAKGQPQGEVRANLEKIVVNFGVGRLRAMPNFEDKVVPELISTIAAITGQAPAARKAKKSVASFKLREGEVVGYQVTLRRARMEAFLRRLVAVVFPRVKDFRGIDVRNVDEHGNLNVGFRDQFVFPEINLEKSRISFGVQVTCVTKSKNRDAAIAFYRSVGVPLKSS